MSSIGQPIDGTQASELSALEGLHSTPARCYLSPEPIPEDVLWAILDAAIRGRPAAIPSTEMGLSIQPEGMLVCAPERNPRAWPSATPRRLTIPAPAPP